MPPMEDFDSHRDPKRHLLVQKHIIQRIDLKIGPPAFCTAQPFTQSPEILRFAIGQTVADTPLKCLFPLWHLHPHLVHGSLGPTDSASQTASRSVLAQLTAERSYTLQWVAPFPKDCPFPWCWLLLVMAALYRADHYIFALWFLSSFFFFFSSPNLSGRRLDVYDRPTSKHGVALVRI